MSQNTHEELWKQIDGFPNYTVSNRGRVKNIMSGKVLKNMIDTHGYATVCLFKGNGTKPKTVRVHRLVAEAFIPNSNNLPQVNHIDEDKTNNDASNLEWCTISQNTRHSIYRQSCRINQYTLDGELVKTWESSKQIKRELGYDHRHIIDCCKYKRKQANGFKWVYADPSQQRVMNRPVVALTKDGEFVAEYKSVAEASRCLKICRQSIQFHLNGKYKSTHGYKFIYLD